MMRRQSEENCNVLENGHPCGQFFLCTKVIPLMEPNRKSKEHAKTSEGLASDESTKGVYLKILGASSIKEIG
jgi:hypothetical protein